MVVGAREGGLKETIIHEETGFLIDDPTPIKIAQAIKKLEIINPKNYVNRCISHAKKFSLVNFNKKIEQTFTEFQRVKFYGSRRSF
jgi:glycogen synthase